MLACMGMWRWISLPSADCVCNLGAWQLGSFRGVSLETVVVLPFCKEHWPEGCCGNYNSIAFVHCTPRLTRVLRSVAAFCSSRKVIVRFFWYGLRFLSLNYWSSQLTCTVVWKLQAGWCEALCCSHNNCSIFRRLERKLAGMVALSNSLCL